MLYDDDPRYLWRSSDSRSHIITAIPNFAEVPIENKVIHFTDFYGHQIKQNDETCIVANFHPHMDDFFNLYKAKENALQCTPLTGTRVSVICAYIDCFRDTLNTVYPDYGQKINQSYKRCNGLWLSKTFNEGIAVCSETAMLGMESFKDAPFDVKYFGGGIVCDSTKGKVAPHAFLLIDDTYFLDLQACCHHPDRVPYLFKPTDDVNMTDYLIHLQAFPDCGNRLLACRKVFDDPQSGIYHYGAASHPDFNLETHVANRMLKPAPSVKYPIQTMGYRLNRL
jgi:hypothetical protein